MSQHQKVWLIQDMYQWTSGFLLLWKFEGFSSTQINPVLFFCTFCLLSRGWFLQLSLRRLSAWQSFTSWSEPWKENWENRRDYIRTLHQDTGASTTHFLHDQNVNFEFPDHLDHNMRSDGPGEWTKRFEFEFWHCSCVWCFSIDIQRMLYVIRLYGFLFICLWPPFFLFSYCIKTIVFWTFRIMFIRSELPPSISTKQVELDDLQ